jgi:hypothetical protein
MQLAKGATVDTHVHTRDVRRKRDLVLCHLMAPSAFLNSPMCPIEGMPDRTHGPLVRYVACTDVDIARRFFALNVCDKDLKFHVQAGSEPKHGQGYVVDRNSCRRLFEGTDSPQQESAECLFKEMNSSV